MLHIGVMRAAGQTCMRRTNLLCSSNRPNQDTCTQDNVLNTVLSVRRHHLYNLVSQSQKCDSCILKNSVRGRRGGGRYRESGVLTREQNDHRSILGQVLGQIQVFKIQCNAAAIWHGHDLPLVRVKDWIPTQPGAQNGLHMPASRSKPRN